MLRSEYLLKIEGSDAEHPIHATLTTPRERGRVPLVVLVHGFKGFRNWAFFPFAAQHFASLGAFVLRFDFAYNGMQGSNDRVLSESDFAVNTVTQECADLSVVLKSIESDNHLTALLDSCWDGRIHLIGHSRGAAITLISAAEYAAIQGHFAHISKIVLWNPVGSLARWTERQKKIWLSDGFVTVENSRTKQLLRMDASYVKDIDNNLERFNLATHLNQLAERTLVVHAAQDVTVPLKESRKLIDRSGSHVHLQVIDNTGHTFGITHPVEIITRPFVEVTRHSAAWLDLMPVFEDAPGLSSYNNRKAPDTTP